jgi:hypothetical protein
LHDQRGARDMPDPAFGVQDARAWHMTAVRRAWIGEFVPPERVPVCPARATRTAPLPPRLPPRLPPLGSPPLQPLPESAVAPAGSSQAGDAAPRPARSAAASSPDHLALGGPAAHNRRRKRPGVKHGVTTEA